MHGWILKSQSACFCDKQAFLWFIKIMTRAKDNKTKWTLVVLLWNCSEFQIEVNMCNLKRVWIVLSTEKFWIFTFNISFDDLGNFQTFSILLSSLVEAINRNEHRIGLKYNFKFSTKPFSKQEWIGLDLYVHVQMRWKTKAPFVER